MANTGFFNPEEIKQLIGVHEGMHIADFGSGSGDIAIMLAKMVGNDGAVVALDVQPSAIEAVQSRAKHLKLENIQAVRANLEIHGGSKLPDTSQDAVFVANILWQTPKKSAIIAEAFRILKHGGTLAAVEWTPSSDRAHSFGPPQEARIGRDELKRLFKIAGLASVSDFAAGAFHYGLLAKK